MSAFYISSFEARITAGHEGQAGPIELFLSVGHGRYKMVSNNAGNGHWRAHCLGGFDGKLYILQTELQRKAGGLESPVRCIRPVVLVNRRTEQFNHCIQEKVLVNTGFSHHCKSFTEGLYHARDHEVAAELQGIRLPRLRADHKRLTPNCVRQRANSLDCAIVSGENDNQLLRFSRIRPSKDRRADENLFALAMLTGKPAG